RSIAVDHRPLNLDGAAHCIDDARKLDQHAVASSLDDAPVMLGDFRIDQLATMRLQAVERAFLIRPHQPRVARHIGGQDRGKATRRGRVTAPRDPLLWSPMPRSTNALRWAAVPAPQRAALVKRRSGA